MRWTGAASALVSAGMDPVIALSRLLMALTGLVAIYIDPTQPARHAETAYYMLVGYVVFAAIVAMAAMQRPQPRAVQTATHICDVFVFGILMYLTDGPTSPFFSYFTFGLVVATLRWSWHGALSTLALLLAVFALITLMDQGTLSGEEDDIIRLAIRWTYLIVAALLLATIAAHRRRSSRRLATLAQWPPEVSVSEFPTFERSLAHLTRVLDVRSALFLWESEEDPFLHVVSVHDGCYTAETLPAQARGAFGPEELSSLAFLAVQSRADEAFFADRTSIRVREFGERLKALQRLGGFVSAPIQGTRFNGSVFMAARGLDLELIAVAQIVARRVQIELEHHFHDIEMQELAGERERLRLARDVHDDTLQALTAVRLQLHALSTRLDDDARKRLGDAADILSHQQQRIRGLIGSLRGRAETRPVDTPLAPLVREVCGEIERQWSCGCSAVVDPPDIVLTDQLCGQLRFMILEAGANAARHSGATAIDIRVTKTGPRIHLRIRNDVTTGTAPEPEMREPASIRERVFSLNGILSLSRSPRETELSVEIPL